MAGIYIHIPYCVQACHYCDFHFSTNRKNQAKMVDCIVEEVKLRKNYLGDSTLNTIYFGGGTPSLLDRAQLQKILTALYDHFQVSPAAEVTIEVNPDDIGLLKGMELRQLGFNRLSIGIQTFNENQLTYLNRAHNALQAYECIKHAHAAGFTNISIDLIYGIPAKDHSLWQEDLRIALSLGVQHISAYCLTIEPSTVFGKWVKTKKIPIEDENYNTQQFEYLIEELESRGFEQYEISNFALKGFISKHNSNYWNEINYLGLGPGAHSFDGVSRQFNVSNNALYIRNLELGVVPFTVENLDDKTRANEYMMTRLRTKWGFDLNQISEKFKMPLDLLSKIIEKHVNLGNLKVENSLVFLTKKGTFVADRITEDLFFI